MIKWGSIIRIVGLLITLISFFMLIPIIISFIYGDGGGTTFIKSFIASFVLGILLWFPTRKGRSEFNIREGFLIVILFWVVLGSIGSFPFIFDKHLQLDFTTAMFESFSGLTTTGATSIAHPEALPKAILFYRQFQQWLGGMGIIVLAVAILPLLGIGGMQLYRAEIQGPQKNTKVRPRIAQTAKSLWFIYILLTVLCSISLFVAGMDFFDAMSHSFSTVSIGGFSTHAESLAYYNSATINYIIAFFVMLSGCNYGLHFLLFTSFSIKQYVSEQEFKFFLFILLVIILICVVGVYSSNSDYTTRIDKIITQAISTATTAGFSIDNTEKWPTYLAFFLTCTTFIGCCAGSTGGGMKVVRFLLLCMQGSRELKRLLHPNAIYNLKLNRQMVSARVIESVWGFFSAYAFVFLVSFFIIMMTGITPVDSFYIVSSSLNNLGIPIDAASSTFSHVGSTVKWIMMLDMIFGRLEIFTLLVIFSPSFWRK